MKKTIKRTSTRKSTKQDSLFSRFLVNKNLLFVFSFALVGVTVFGLTSAAPSNRCTPNAPYVQIHNNYAWAQWGTWATPGQTVPYQLQVYNRDQGNCRRETINVNLTLPSGFTADAPNFSVMLRPSESQLKMVNITSPANTPNGDYPVTATGTRTTSAASLSETSYYKVYSTDTLPPTFYWTSPLDGSTVSGNVDLANNARDDRMARKMELFIDGNLVKTETNVGIVNAVTLRYTWETRNINKGQHAVIYKAYDDFGNSSTMNASYNVQ